MPANTPPPADDRPAPAGSLVDTACSDEHALIGYECALPWLQAVAPATNPTRAPGPGASAD